MAIEEIIETIIMKEVEVGLEKDSFQVMPEGMTEEVVVGLDQVQDLVLIEIRLDVISVENTMICQRLSDLKKRDGNRTGTTDVQYGQRIDIIKNVSNRYL